MVQNNDLVITRDWEREGALDMANAKTVKLYEEIMGYGDKKCEVHKVTSNPAYCFFAFGEQQFKEGYAKMKPYLKEGEHIYSIGYGGYMTRAGIEAYKRACTKKDKLIKEECCPQEVYCYEWNNHECMFDYDGDAPALKLIIEYFGKRVAKTIKRYNAYLTFERVCEY